MIFEYKELERRLSPEDRELYEACISLNANYDVSTKGNKDLKQRQRDLKNRGCLKDEPMDHKIARLAANSDRDGDFYKSLREIAEHNKFYVDFRELAICVYDMLTKNPSKSTRVPYLYGDSNSGKSCLLRAIEYLTPTAKKNNRAIFSTMVLGAVTNEHSSGKAFIHRRSAAVISSSCLTRLKATPSYSTSREGVFKTLVTNR